MLSASLAVWMLMAADPVNYLGRLVKVVEPGTESDGFPKGEAKVCFEGQTEKNCYTAPNLFGRQSSLSVINLNKDEQALFFESASGGVSGWSLHFALLKLCDQDDSPGCKSDELINHLPERLRVSNLSRHAWWDASEISDSKIFLTAEWVWSPGETKISNHRYDISVYGRRSHEEDVMRYYLVDRFMTARAYGLNRLGELADVLGEEKQEILSRLRRVKASWDEQAKSFEPKP